MPRSFLLRRSIYTGDEPGNEKNTKLQRKGVATTFSKGVEEKRFTGFYKKNSETIFWSNEENKAFKGPFTYQSYIDGDMIGKNGRTDFVLAGKDFVESQSKSMIKELDNKGGLKGEMKQRAENNPASKPIYSCEQCGKTFKTKYTLTIHLKMPSHTGARPFVCNICGKGFRLSSTLCRHKIIHTSEKPHRCTICQKAFNRSSTLKTHIRTHSEKKEFVCDVCGKGFHQKGNLRNHFLIHTGEKPYDCRLCHKSFNKLSNLKFHLHVHTDNTPYRCRYCKTAFSRRCDLKQHMQSEHDGQHNEYFDQEEI